MAETKSLDHLTSSSISIFERASEDATGIESPDKSDRNNRKDIGGNFGKHHYWRSPTLTAHTKSRSLSAGHGLTLVMGAQRAAFTLLLIESEPLCISLCLLSGVC